MSPSQKFSSILTFLAVLAITVNHIVDVTVSALPQHHNSADLHQLKQLVRQRTKELAHSRDILTARLQARDPRLDADNAAEINSYEAEFIAKRRAFQRLLEEVANREGVAVTQPMRSAIAA